VSDIQPPNDIPPSASQPLSSLDRPGVSDTMGLRSPGKEASGMNIKFSEYEANAVKHALEIYLKSLEADKKSEQKAIKEEEIAVKSALDKIANTPIMT